MTESKNPLLPVVLCGGSGSRLWPLSRESYPKQFLSLTGSRTMLQETALRLRGLGHLPVASAPILVCNAEHRFLAASQMQEAGVSRAQIVLEPAGRSTAPALTLAALQAQVQVPEQSPAQPPAWGLPQPDRLTHTLLPGQPGPGGDNASDPILLAMPADHVMADLQAFHAAIQQAYPIALGGAMVTFGIVADKPETGYGYIECGQPWHAGGHQIASFAEKPDLARARAYLNAGNYLWNSGLFMVRASVWIKAIQQCRPDIYQACAAAMANAQIDADFVRPNTPAFSACPSDSIDYAVMERLPARPDLQIPACVVPLQAGWSDLGAWDALWQVRQHDTQGNAHVGDTIQHGCTNSLLLSSSRLVAGVGLDNIAVIETPDAILVVDKNQTQDVKQIVNKLKDAGHTLTQTHRKVHRPWGWYDSIDSGDRFQVKRIVVNPGARLSMQMHYHRAEHWVVVRGTAEITNGEDTFLLAQNESTFIPVGRRHRLANPGKTHLEIIEVQSGDYLGDDDIVRFDDIYGRTSGADDVP
ncbi:mannose-1-phosphate guanylyltransferase/mannose-6-phosphate isomerase [Acidovorax sp.]|uniref:mannose-1-phosphate guanylyltransferase/mannose-6-phosphate isomerase n=1 Tax=Acidovorax sp. TaxID=1872122 RepID=UPI00391F65A6